MKEDQFSFASLIYACPLKHEHINCSFKKLRIMPIEQRIIAMLDIKEQEQIEMMVIHNECYINRNVLMMLESDKKHAIQNLNV